MSISQLLACGGVPGSVEVDNALTAVGEEGEDQRGKTVVSHSVKLGLLEVYLGVCLTGELQTNARTGPDGYFHRCVLL